MADAAWLAQKEIRRLAEAKRAADAAEAARKYRAHMKWRSKEQLRCAHLAKTPAQKEAFRQKMHETYVKQNKEAKRVADKRQAFCDELAVKARLKQQHKDFVKATLPHSKPHFYHLIYIIPWRSMKLRRAKENSGRGKGNASYSRSTPLSFHETPAESTLDLICPLMLGRIEDESVHQCERTVVRRQRQHQPYLPTLTLTDCP